MDDLDDGLNSDSDLNGSCQKGREGGFKKVGIGQCSKTKTRFEPRDMQKVAIATNFQLKPFLRDCNIDDVYQSMH